MKKPCCQIKENLQREVVSEDKFIDRCLVCGCRHFVMKADPGVLASYIGLK